MQRPEPRAGRLLGAGRDRARSAGPWRSGSCSSEFARSEQHVGRDDAADRAAQVRLPGDPVVRDEAREQRAAPDRRDDRSGDEFQRAAVEQSRARAGRTRSRTRRRWRRSCSSRSGAISHVPIPPTTITISVTINRRTAPRRAMITPMNMNGIVLSIRCWKLAWMNGEVKIPHRWSTLRGMIPSLSRWLESTVLITSISHIKATIADQQRPCPRPGSARERCGSFGVHPCKGCQVSPVRRTRKNLAAGRSWSEAPHSAHRQRHRGALARATPAARTPPGVCAPPPRGPSPSTVSGIDAAKWLASLAPPRCTAVDRAAEAAGGALQQPRGGAGRVHPRPARAPSPGEARLPISSAGDGLEHGVERRRAGRRACRPSAHPPPARRSTPRRNATGSGRRSGVRDRAGRGARRPAERPGRARRSALRPLSGALPE